ncbi:glycosyltransferase family 2 protein [Nonomuraea cavernae]|uniref:glycosyltransferase family 2 protein n=1 Tax=Nonomuraea cavernae TaxID=2045107 RepID=UPI0033FFE34C
MTTGDGPADAGLSIVIPCFDEADNVGHVYAEVVAEFGDLDLEVIFVDDGSGDGTLPALKALADADPRVQYISFTRNFGFEAAFSAGYRYASRPWVLHLDADQQFPAAEARRLIEAAARGRHDAVFGVRAGRDDPWIRRLGSAGFHALAARLGIEVPRGATAFRLVRTSLARTVVDLRLGSPNFLATVPRLTNRYTTVPVGHRARLRGTSKMNVRGLARHAVDLYVSVGRRLTTVVTGLAVGAGAVALLCALATALGLLGPAAGRAAGFLLAAVALAVLGFTVRHLVSIAAGQAARPRLFYVRESTVPIRDEDRLLDLADTTRAPS